MIAYLIIVLIVAEYATCGGWKYHDEEHWSPLCNEGKLQSPIALDEHQAKSMHYVPFNFTGYGELFEADMKNNGHSAELRPDFGKKIPEVNGGGLQETYRLDHLHFHWQSEHTMDNYRFPLELHIVHYAKRYGSLDLAKQHVGGVAVLAVLFDLSPDDDDEFQPLVNILETIQEDLNDPKELDDFVVKKFLPRDHAGFFRYDGSLTTPGCEEGVVWTIFTHTMPISRKQVETFERIRTEDNTVLKENYRSIQPLNGRPVYIKISPIRPNVGYGSGGETMRSSTLLYLISCISYLLTTYRS
ncbi:hypothetical protein JTB14_018814 [Gonioctena quinquepunctata]|nr:hypothetical protein JTB14_018814 [Gonioctena quinquepunctata]